MSNIPNDLRYAASHEWVRDDGEDTVTVGISDHAQGLLGDLVYVELPELGREVTANEDCCVVESVKAASDVYSPVSGEIIAVNDSLEAEPGTVNQEPYGQGWLFQIKLSDKDELNQLMDANAYKADINE